MMGHGGWANRPRGESGGPKCPLVAPRADLHEGADRGASIAAGGESNHNMVVERARGVAATGPTAMSVRSGHRTGIHPLHRLQSQAGNAAVARLVAVQRDDGSPATPATTPTPTTGPTTPGQLHIDAHEVPPAATTAQAGDGTASATPGAAQPAQKQFQVQYAFQGQATQATGQPKGQADQTSAVHQVTAQLNVSHHDDDHPGAEQSYALQGGFDASTGHFTGAVFQVQDALVTATRHHLQGQVFGNASAGVAADPSGVLRPVAQAGVGVQGNLVINNTFQVFLQAEDQASLMAGPRGATVSNSEQVSAGIQITFP